MLIGWLIATNHMPGPCKKTHWNWDQYYETNSDAAPWRFRGIVFTNDETGEKNNDHANTPSHR
jgi:hypothetical protein